VNWSEFISFRRMVTPVIIQILFWIGVAGSVLVGLVALGNDEPVAGLLLIVLGPLFVRIYCELLIVIFRIHDSLRAVERNTAPASTYETLPPAVPPAA
jgi:hypothetical protein